MPFAFVPHMPGPVIQVTEDNMIGEENWYHFNGPVVPKWSFDGNTFSPPPPEPVISYVEPTPPPVVDTSAQDEAAKHNSDIAAQIAVLETKSNRALREYALGRPEALTRLQQYDIDITLLRSKLV